MEMRETMLPAKTRLKVIFCSALFFLFISLIWFNSSGISNERKGIHAKLVADYIHSVIEANRTFYSKQVVERLGKSISLRSTENWIEDDTLPLPAQFLIASSEISNTTGVGMNYSLISLQPLNKMVRRRTLKSWGCRRWRKTLRHHLPGLCKGREYGIFRRSTLTGRSLNPACHATITILEALRRII